jgi:hypothetical protein
MTFAKNCGGASLPAHRRAGGIHVTDGSAFATGKIPQQGVLLEKDGLQRGVA